MSMEIQVGSMASPTDTHLPEENKTVSFSSECSMFRYNEENILMDNPPPLKAESDVSSDDETASLGSSAIFVQDEEEFEADDTGVDSLQIPLVSTPKSEREPLRWEFQGLTLWLELEEFDNDITQAIGRAAEYHNLRPIPQSHTTAIYGMTHLSVPEAVARLNTVKDKISQWPIFDPPSGIVQDIATAGNPGQVCSIAWAELTLSSNSEHESALDDLYDIFFEPADGNICGNGKCSDKARRHRPWTPHNSLAYDNPEETVLTLEGMLRIAASYPTLLARKRRVKALSLWDTNGQMEAWKPLHRIHFF